MTIVNIHDAKTQFSKLLERVSNGEEVVIAKAGKPVARLVPFVDDEKPPRIPGIDKGKLTIIPDFDATLVEFDL